MPTGLKGYFYKMVTALSSYPSHPLCVHMHIYVYINTIINLDKKWQLNKKVIEQIQQNLCTSSIPSDVSEQSCSRAALASSPATLASSRASRSSWWSYNNEENVMN